MSSRAARPDAEVQGAVRRVWTHPTMLAVVALSLVAAAPYNCLPVLFSTIEREFGATLELQGSTQQYLLSAGILVAVTGGFLVRRLGANGAAVGALLGCALGLLAMSLGPDFHWFRAGCFLYGFGIASVYVVSGTLISNHFAEQRQRAFLISNMAVSVAAGIGPIAMGVWITNGLPWRTAYLSWSVVSLGVGAALFAAFKNRGGSPSGATRHHGRTLHPARTLPMWVIAFCYFLHGLAEIGAITWIGKLYQKRIGTSEDGIALLISLHVLAFGAGRFLLTFMAGRLPDRLLLAVCSGFGGLLLLLVIATSNYVAASVLMALSGMFMSGNHPALSSFLGRRFYDRLPDAFAVYQGVGAFGSALAARLIGFLGDRAGLETAIYLIPAPAACLCVVAAGWEYFERPLARRSEAAAQ